MSARAIIPKDARLTPRLKRVLETAIKQIKKGHTQNAYMVDAVTGECYDEGWHKNGKKPLVCAVGGVQRAAWIECGQPNMSGPSSSKYKEVCDLACRAEKRLNLFVPSPDDPYMWDDNSIIDFNDSLPVDVAKKQVLEVFAKALGR